MLNYMALAGYDAETSMTMLPNVLNLAAAGGIELAAASDMVTDAQSALGLTLDETSELVDKMAAASSKSNTSVQQLGDAILTVGGTAKNLAGGTTELSMALGVLADNGIKGSEGGTALRNMILSLSAPTDKAAAELEALGVKAFDAEGNLRPLNETFGDLNGALSSLTQEEQTQALNTIFNKVDLKSVNAMLGTSAERFEELSTAIDGAWVNIGSLSESLTDVGLDLTTMQSNLSKLGISESNFNDILKISGGNASDFADILWEAADAGVTQEDVLEAIGGNLEDLQTAFDNTTGAAQAMADTQLDNLAGDITLFQSALEGAQIVISDVLSPSLREFTQFGTASVTKLSEAFQEGGFTGAMEALGGILSDGLGMVIEMLPTAINAGMQLLGALGQGLLDNAPLIIDAAIQIVNLLGDGILSSLPVLAGSAMEIIASLASGIGEMLPELIPSVVETVMLVAGALIENLPLVIDAGMQLISGLADGIIGAVPVLIGQLPVLIDQILGFLSESLPTFLEHGATILTKIGEGLMETIPMLVEMLPEIITSICGFVTENLPTILEQGVQILTTLASGIIGALPELIGQIPAIISGIVGTLSENFPEIVSTGATMLQELGNGIISMIPVLVSQLPAIGSAILGALGEIPGMVISVGKSIVEGLWSGISSMASWVGEKVKGFASGIVDGIKGFLGIHSPSTVFAEIGDNMALGLGNGFSDSMEDVSGAIQDAVPTELEAPALGVDQKSIDDLVSDTVAGLDGISSALKSSGVDWEKYKDAAWATADNAFDGLVEDLKYNLGELGTSAEELQEYLQFEYDLDADDAMAVMKSMSDLGNIRLDYQIPDTAGLDEYDIGKALEASGVDWEKYSDKAWASMEGISEGLVEDIKHNLGEVGTSAEELQEYLQFEYDLDAEDAKAVLDSIGDAQRALSGNAADLQNIPDPVVAGVEPPEIPDVTYGVNPRVEEYDLPGNGESAFYTISPVVEEIDEIGNAVEDAVYNVSPIIEDIKTPPVSDIYYSVNPLVEDFTPPGYEMYTDTEDSESDHLEHVNGNGNGGPNPDGTGVTGNGGDSGSFTFAPVATFQITIEGSADREALEELKAELEAKMREMCEEFQEEMFQQAALKNQYAWR